MKLKVSLCFLLAAFIAIEAASRDRNNKPHKVVCYWGTWSYYRPENGKFSVDNIDPNVCTHLIYGFAKLNGHKIDVFDSYLDIGDQKSGGLGMYKKFNELRKKNPHLTTMIAIGGWNEGSIKYSEMAKSPASRKEFVDSVVKFLETHNFDGLDLDWEYPGFLNEGQKGGNPVDKEHFSALAKELSDAFQPKGYLLTAAVSAGKGTIDVAYDVPALSKYLNFINLMAYDFHGGWEQETGANAPLHPKQGASGIDLEFTVEYALNYWLKKGADPKKIVMGMPLYGRSWTLAGKDNGYKSKAVGAGGNAGPYTRQAGILGYNEICVMLKQGGWTVKRDDVFKVPYMVKGNQWVNYDDTQSIKDKVDFLKSKGLAGGMVWSIETDDFRGLCGTGTYPLLRTIGSELNKDSGPDPDHTPSPPVTTQSPTWEPQTTTESTKSDTDPTDSTTESPESTTTDKPGKEFVCKNVGFYPDPNDKTVFYECVDQGNGKLKKFTFHCGAGTVYDPMTKVCKSANS